MLIGKLTFGRMPNYFCDVVKNEPWEKVRESVTNSLTFLSEFKKISTIGVTYGEILAVYII